MLSLQAKIIKRIIGSSIRQQPYDQSHIRALRRNFNRNLALMFPSTSRGLHRELIAGVSVAVFEPKFPTQRFIIYVHGGGFIVGSAASYQQHIKRVGRLCRAKVYAIDYSLAPESPYPVALDQITSVWNTLISKQMIEPKRTAFMGDSAGGNLALASLLKFRDQNIALPSCIALLSPELDATMSGESHRAKVDADPMLTPSKLALFVDAYAAATPKTDPLVSPVYADLRGLPPMLVQVGSDELLLSDSQTITNHAQRDEVEATLFVGDGLWHGWHFFALIVPEAKQAMNDIAEFVKRHS